MAKIQLNLISGRTIQQGVAIEGGKEKPAYREACGIIELDAEDFKKLGIYRNTHVRVTSPYGSVIVKAVDATQGPWANSVTNPNTYSTGMPTFKGVPIEVEPAPNEPVLLGIELVQKACRAEG